MLYRKILCELLYETGVLNGIYRKIKILLTCNFQPTGRLIIMVYIIYYIYFKNLKKVSFKVLTSDLTCVIILKHATLLCRVVRRYALMREVATHRGREFSRSMSDLKPGDLITCTTVSLYPWRSCVYKCVQDLNALFPETNPFPVFKCGGLKHPDTLRKSGSKRCPPNF